MATLTPPTPPERRPGRGVHLTEAEKHAWHHYRIAQDRYEYDVLQRRGATVR